MGSGIQRDETDARSLGLGFVLALLEIKKILPGERLKFLVMKRFCSVDFAVERIHRGLGQLELMLPAANLSIHRTRHNKPSNLEQSRPCI